MTSLTLPAAGTYLSTGLTTVKFGPSSLNTLPAVLSSLRLVKAGEKPRSLILTGNTLATKTKVISRVEEILGDTHAFTFTSIGEHAPVEGIEKAVEVSGGLGF